MQGEMPAMFAINQLVGVVVMLLAGILGGYVGSILSRFASSEDEDENRTLVSVREATVAGIAAAFVVPVFLSIASLGSSGSLIETIFQPIGSCAGTEQAEACRGFVPSLLLLASFCIVVGASYRAFFSGISQRLLESLKDKVKKLDANIQDLEEEPDLQAPTTDERPQDADELPDEQGAVLDALIQKPRTRRSVGAIALDKNLDPLQVRTALSGLVSMGLAEEIESRTKPGSKRFRVDAESLSARVRRDPKSDKFYVK